MRLINFILLSLITIFVSLTTACNKFTVENVDYSQRIESVLTPDEKGIITDKRYAISFNIQPFKKQEFGDSDSSKVEELRLIRNEDGYYFITASAFKNIYVMQPEKGSLKLVRKIKIGEERISEPALNLRDTTVQLVNRDTGEIYLLTQNGIVEKINA
ncbi:MAG: hypothetical protein RI564_04960 [Gracilimonas sp.]|nr:hypothetical protein [Gracilimonas sp.]